jgi:hypothetical protein
MDQKTDVGAAYLAEALRGLRQYKRLAEDAMKQISDSEMFYSPDDESNSVAVIVKHMAGNMRSRWTGFLESDGEKPDRNRDDEFIMHEDTGRADVMEWWEKGWGYVFSAVEALEPADLAKTITIRGEAMPALQGINRQVMHYAYHVGQIVYLAKHLRSSEWQTLSIARGKSGEPQGKLKFG